jgi:hypothetical protein
LRGTPRFGFARKPNALNFEVNLIRLFEAASVPASWRVVLHCSRRNSPYPLRWLVVRVGMLWYIVFGGRFLNPPLRCARPHRCAWLLCARKRAVCIEVGVAPRTFTLFLSVSFFLCCSHTCQHFAKCMRRRILLPYSKYHRRATLRACGAKRAAASRCKSVRVSQPPVFLSRRWLLPSPHPRFPLRSACLADGSLLRATKSFAGGGYRSYTPAFRCARLLYYRRLATAGNEAIGR